MTLLECENAAMSAIDSAFDLDDEEWQSFLTTVQSHLDEKDDERDGDEDDDS